MSAAAIGPLWCDDFDADLPKVVPHATEELGVSAHVQLRTYCKPTNGRINCPTSWWTQHGLTAFFAEPGFGNPAPGGYVTSDPLVECTFAEVVRDEWIHGSVVVVNRQFVWTPPSRLMERLMFDVRGWTPLSEPERLQTQQHVRASLRAAADRLERALEAA